MEININNIIKALTILLISACSSNVFAIGENYDETGFRSNKTYLQYSSQEFVNPFSGNLILSHTDIVLPGNGGLDLEIQRTYNSKLFLDPDTSEISRVRKGALGIGWTLHFGRIVEEPFSPHGPLLYLEMPDGSFHNLYHNDHSNINSHITSDYLTEDFWIVNYDQANDRYLMTLTDGTVYTFGQRVDSLTTIYYYASSIKDTNGNEIKIDYFDCCNMVNNDPKTGTIGTCPGSDPLTKTPHIRQIIDSVGRLVNFGLVTNTCSGNAVSSIDTNGKVYAYSYFIINDGGTIGYLLSEVKSPEGPSWKYFYDADGVHPEGELISATYPTGAVVQYQYDTFNISLVDNPSPPFKLRAINSRTVSGPSISTGTWTYSYDAMSNQDTTTVIDACGNKEIYRFYGLRELSFDGIWKIGLVKSKEILDGDNSILQSDINTWSLYQISEDGDDPLMGISGSYFPLLNSRRIYRDGNDYVTNFAYNTFYGAPTEIQEIGQLTRTTSIWYLENLSDGNYIVDKRLVTDITIDSDNRKIINSYDSKGNLISENKYGVITQFSYDSDGNLEWEKNARGIYTHFDQYDFGITGRIRYGSSSDTASNPVYTETRIVNWEGTIGSLTNGRGHQTHYSYDGLNRLIKITPPSSGEAETLINHDNTSGRTYTIKKGISEVRYDFDGFGRPIGTVSNAGVLTESSYDQCGRKIYQSLPFAIDNSTPNSGDSFTYDILGRLGSVLHPDGTTTKYSYPGNRITVTNERNISTTFNFNSFGHPEDKRLISVMDPQSGITSYEYDLLGNVIRVDSSVGGDRVFNYSTKGFLISETHPESGANSFEHDEVGNVTSKTDAMNRVIRYQYDPLNRLTFIDHPSEEDDVFYEYDGSNNRTLMESTSGSYSYSFQYDQSNRLTRQGVISGNIGYSVDFVYDERNNLIKTIYPSGEVVNSSYDAANRVLDIYDASNILFVGNITYHPSGAPIHYVNSNFVSSDFTYDNRHRLRTLEISRPFPELKVIKEGLGDGIVTSDPLGINCGNDCSQIYPADGITVTLAAIPDQDSNFVSWGGDPDCSDGEVLMDRNKTCVGTFALIANQFTLTVSKEGTGTGTVTSSPAGIDCGEDCTENYDASTQVTLTPVPDEGSNFSGWSGDQDCSDGVVTMDASKTCTATFEPIQQFTLTVNKVGTGTGGITSSPVGIDCGGDCTENYDANISVTLTATPAVGSKFVAWTGDSDCTDGTITMDANKICTAQFSPMLTLTIQKAGTGSGTVISVNYEGINCGNDCSEGYDENALIQLNATPDPGSQFAGWSGNPDCSDNLVTMDVNKTCIATFNLLPPNQFTLTVSKEGDGFGTVTSSPSGINCGNDCNQTFGTNTKVTLNAVANGGSIFVGWSGDPDCSDGLVTMDANKTCTVTFRQSGEQFTLRVDVSGFGLVEANPTGLHCLGAPASVPFNNCVEDYAVNSLIRLTPTPIDSSFNTNPPIDYKSTFLGWDGDPDCLDGEVTMEANKLCKAIFTPFKLDIFTTGAGTILKSPQGNTCTTFSNCSKYYQPNTQVALTPVPNAGSVFSGWSVDPDCSDGLVTMNMDKTCRATFTTSSEQFTLTVAKSGTGTGTVESSPSGINCGSDCSQNFAASTEVRLTATPDAGSVFEGWSGHSDCSDGIILMDGAKSCTATFALSPQTPECDCSHPDAIMGTEEEDMLVGTSNADIICGFGGNDTLRGLGGGDCIDGGSGKDKIFGGGGKDKLHGGSGDDTIKGGGGNDFLDGGTGVDTMDGGKKTDTCINGETVTNCESSTSSVRGTSTEAYQGNRIIVGNHKSKANLSSITGNANVLESLEQGPGQLGFRKLAKLLRPRSYLDSLRIFLISLLFSANAYAQAVPPTTFIDLEYAYDAVGNVTTINDHNDSQNNCSMQYDNLDRLTTADGRWGPGAFTYDALGNRTNKSIASANTNYSYGPSDNRLGGYSHDANGNLLQDDNFTYQYDSENRLTTVISGGTIIVQYQYDGDGRRISKTADGETTYYAYGRGLNVLTEFDGQGIPKYDYIYLGNKNVARVNFESDSDVDRTTFYHSDHLGSNVAITDAFTTVIWNQSYLPFGEYYTGTGSLSNTHQYTGKEFQEETGLYYYGARYYHPGLGRFMSVDPAGGDLTDPQSWNRYAYVLNNPYKYVDPDGEVAVNVSGIVKLNTKVRNKLGFVPNFILDALLPVEPQAIVASALLEPQALATGAVTRTASKALLATQARFEGVRELSRTLIKAGVSRENRGDIINSFLDGKITRRIAAGNENVIRYFGGKAGAKGRFVTPSLPTFGSVRDVLALPPENLGTELIQFMLRKGAVFFEGPVAPNFQRPGGGVQYFVPNLDDLLPVL